MKEKIMNDYNFREKCNAYGGVDWEKFDLVENAYDNGVTIVLYTQDKDVVVLMDSNYNTIGIHRFTKDDDRRIEDIIYDYKAITNYIYLDYELRIVDILNIADRVNFFVGNHGHSARLIVNNQVIDTTSGKEYVQLLSYITFLSVKIKEYYKELYKAKILNLEFPSIMQYLTSLILNMHKCIDKCIEENKRPWPADICNSIGDSLYNLNEDYIIYEIIELFLLEKGYTIGSGDDYNSIEKTSEEVNYFTKSIDLFNILDVSKEEIKNHEIKMVTFDELLKGNSKNI